jgi:small subunit ribosomal protein S20
LQSEKRRLRNVRRKSSIKTAIKKLMGALEQKEIVQAKEMFKNVMSQLARAKGKGVLHANTAARKTSRLARKIALVEKQK